MKKYNIIYKITFLKGSFAGKYYIGQHQTNLLEDGYTGSGMYPVKYFNKYGAIPGKTYTREILEFCDSPDLLNEAEARHLGTAFQSDPNCLNCKAGGTQVGICEETRYKKSIAVKGRSRPKEWVEKSATRNKANWADPSFREEHLKLYKTPEWKEKASSGWRKYWANPENHKKASERRKGRKVSEETRRKHSITTKRNWTDPEYRRKIAEKAKINSTNPSPETIAKRVATRRARGSYKGTPGPRPDSFGEKIRNKVWVHNQTQNARIDKDRVEQYLQSGWVLGRIGWSKRKSNE